MIVRIGPRTLVDVEALAVQHRRPPATIRARCTPIACDLATHRQLYDAEQAAAILATVGRRRPHKRPLRSAAI